MNSKSVPSSVAAASARLNRPLRSNNVARRLDISDREVRYLAAGGKLRGFKVGKLWFFWEADVAEYQTLLYHARRHDAH